MNFTDSVTAPFFNIYRHPKGMKIENTIFAADENQYATGNIEDPVVRLRFDSQYQSINKPNNFAGYPNGVGDVAIQYKRGYQYGATAGKIGHTIDSSLWNSCIKSHNYFVLRHKISKRRC